MNPPNAGCWGQRSPLCLSEPLRAGLPQRHLFTISSKKVEEQQDVKDKCQLEIPRFWELPAPTVQDFLRALRQPKLPLMLAAELFTPPDMPLAKKQEKNMKVE